MKLNDKELSKIVGGNRWGDTVLSAASGAGTGIKACKSFGPWGMAICGVGGAAIGGYFGSIINPVDGYL
ncbi:Blp family class II bacteriocin [Lactobacillus taiwanensis]|uniref:Blp family class II bacteriocin n=1 Tax=Lactobacillus taiwanensis TaxID=508451 RepID=UPI00321FA1B5